MIVGNTVRLRAEFKDFAGNRYNPNDVTVRVLSCNMETIFESTSPSSDETGVYYIDYTLTEDDYAFEFSGVIDSFPVLSREPLNVSNRL